MLLGGGAPLIGLLAERAVHDHPDDPVVTVFALVIGGILLAGSCVGLWQTRDVWKKK